MARHNPQDPTGQARNRKVAALELRVHLGRAQRRVLAAFRAIPRKRRRVADIKTNRDVYEYEYDAAAFAALLALTLDGELVPGDTPIGWYWESNIEQAYRQGALTAINTLNRDITAAGIAGVLVGGLPVGQIDAQQVLLSQPHRDAVAAAVEDGFLAVKGMSGRTASQLQQAVTNGIRAGLTPTEISQLIRERFGVVASSADRIANTEINKAFVNSKMRTGRDAAKRLGLRVAVLHISALIPTTRATHAARHGHTYTMEAQLAWWDSGVNRINCFLPGTRVSGRFTGGVKSFYRGKVIELVTRDGRRVTVTPNHKILTQRGMVPAAKVNKGDYLVADSTEVKAADGVGDLHVHNASAAIEQVFRALSDLNPPTPTRIVGVDFNGDGRFMDKNVDRVLIDGVLPVAMNPARAKLLDNLQLIHADPPPVTSGAFYKTLNSVFAPASGFLSGLRVLFAPSLAHVTGSGCLGGAAPSWAYPRFAQVTDDDAPRHIRTAGYGQDALPVNVQLDQVVCVEISNFCGHVYDLQETSGLMIANGVIASNCHCSIENVLVDRKGNLRDTALRDDLAAERSFFQDAT